MKHTCTCTYACALSTSACMCLDITKITKTGFALRVCEQVGVLSECSALNTLTSHETHERAVVSWIRSLLHVHVHHGHCL